MKFHWASRKLHKPDRVTGRFTLINRKIGNFRAERKKTGKYMSFSGNKIGALSSNDSISNSKPELFISR